MRICPFCAFDRCDDTAERCRQCGAELPKPDEGIKRHRNLESAWFHYLRIPKVGMVELVPGRAFNVGRARGQNELVVPRLGAEQAATFFWTDRYEEATVRAYAGPDQVKIDGIRIKGVRTLKGGEEIEVGPVRLSYVKRATAAPDAIDAAKIGSRAGAPDPGRQVATTTTRRRPDAPLEPKAKKLGGAVATGGGSRRGTVSQTPAAVARALEKTQAGGTLLVRSPLGQGWITVIGGAPRHAKFGDLTGRAALSAILRLNTGRCRMLDGRPTRTAGAPVGETFSQALARLGGPPRPAPGRPRPARPARPGRRPPPGRARPGPPPRGRPRPR